MLLEEHIDLDRFADILVSEELVARDMAAFGAQVRAHSAPSTNVQPVQSKAPGKKWQSGGRKAEKCGEQSADRQDVTCYSCRRKGHFARSDKCPARNDECSYCHKRGHWSGSCRVKQRSREASGQHMPDTTTKSKHIQAGMKAVNSGAHVEHPFICMVNFLDRSGQSHPLNVEVDCRSYCSVIPHPFFDNQLCSLHLQPLRGPSYAYGGIPIEDFDGSCRVRVEFGGKV